MNDQYTRITYTTTQCYLEVARSVLTSIHYPKDTPRDLELNEFNQLVNISFSLISISIVYSFLTIEAFINYQFYQIWEKRNTNDIPSQKFKEMFGNVEKFEDMFKRSEVRELKDRIKILCSILGRRLSR